MGFHSDEEDIATKYIKDIRTDYERGEEVVQDKSSFLEDYRMYEDVCVKKHKKEYKFIEIIDLNNYSSSFYFSRTRVMLLLDDILNVDVMCIGNYYPFDSLNNLKYLLGADDRNLLMRATEYCKEILFNGSDNFKFESTKVFNTLLGKKLTRLYLKDFDYDENQSTINLIEQTILRNEDFKNVEIKIRGRGSNYKEESLGHCSVENTYIQIVSYDVNITLNECINILNDLKRFL